MIESIRFFQEYESLIYLILGFGLISYGWRFWKAWIELKGSIFGLEQINAQRRLNQSAISMFILIVFGFVVFSVVTFISPVMIDDRLISDGSIINSNTPAASDEINGISTEEAPGSSAIISTATPLPTVVVDPGGCVPGEIEITRPKIGEEVRGIYEVEGVVNVDDFGFYKFEYASPQAEIWQPVGVFRELLPEEGLMFEWNTNTSTLPPGNYIIQILVYDSNKDAYPPCRIPILIGNAP